MNKVALKIQNLLPSLPLLNKELIEQANRKRTYLLRTVLITVVGIVLAIVFNENSGRIYSSIYEVSRVGNNIFSAVMLCQLFAVMILLPGMMSTVITMEKERSSLELLFLTHMKPWEIIIQKYLGRVIPVLMFFFLGLPIIAIAYSIGGLDGSEVYEVPILIVALILQIGAFSLMFSAFFATTSESAVCSYLVTILDGVIFFLLMDNYRDFGFNSEQNAMYFFIAFQGVSAVICIFLAVKFLKSRAEAKKRHLIRKGLDILDRLWNDINRLLGNIQIIKEEKNPLPKDNPIAWYEKVKSPVGRVSYRLRLAIIAYVPVMICLVLKESDVFSFHSAWFQVFFVMYLLLTAIILCVSGASVISSERTNQTLDVLLSTPIPSEEIIMEKMKRGRAYVGILFVPIIILSLLVGDRAFFMNFRFFDNIILLLVIFFAYLPLISWFSCLCGLVFKSQARAILVAFVGMVLWLAVPGILYGIDYGETLFGIVICNSSPTVPISEIFIDRGYFRAPEAFYIFSGIIFSIYLFLRYYCLKHADLYLRRR